MERFKNYIEDCIEELIERSSSAKKDADTTSKEFDIGRSFGYYEVLSFLLEQAEIFEIKEEMKENIKNFDPSF